VSVKDLERGLMNASSEPVGKIGQVIHIFVKENSHL
jgi:hypothetical protein